MTTIEKSVEQFFWRTDVDRSGTLSLVELRDALKRNGYTMTDEQFQEKFATFDKDNDGSIAFHEYLEGMGRHADDVKRYAEIARVFQIFDKKQHGYITKDDISDIFRQRGRLLSATELNNIMMRINKDKSGKIKMDEFIDIYENMKQYL